MTTWLSACNFWTEVEGDKYFGDKNRRFSKKEYETHRKSKKKQLDAKKCEKKTRKLIRQNLFSRNRHDSQRHLQNF
ncbi:Protein CBG16199 [Caenorhabditis briggsae]|uniref:Protein CBG16199 n=1 Tax=Caenorhabditis briggsae TaxID=6238 RepID=A8XNW6_CAEBR|nr:Protein CBG16199 [Caenorhabditis briggsae]CAP34206.1 Protein CBG16199 [Caenorhabditis briggsae]